MQAAKPAFANTGHSLRLLEAMAAGVHQREPLLLTGETGTGKTTLVQQLANRVITSSSTWFCLFREAQSVLWEAGKSCLCMK